jgi:hypothetical protein
MAVDAGSEMTKHVSLPKSLRLKIWVRIGLALASGFVGRAAQQPAPGTVYLVVGSDTAIWNAPGTVDAYTRYPYYPQTSFTDSNAPIYQVMDAAWREQFKDSFGQTIKFTWWMMGGSIYRDATNLNIPLANTMTLHLMKLYHGEAIRRFGDELSLHYHTYNWSDYNGTGVYYWNQTRTFAELKDDFDLILEQYLLEEGVFPVSFRSGWHFMDQDWQHYLDGLIPYSFDNNYPARLPWYTNLVGPIAGVEDWSRAPASFVPFHPATNDYQLSGDGPGWNVRSGKMQGMAQVNVDQMFAEASNGVDQVACLWDHLPENFVANVARLSGMIGTAAKNYPMVSYRYCTAVEAMQRWRGLTNEPQPQLVVAEQAGAPLSLVITSTVPIFQKRPFVAVRDAFQKYHNLTDACVSTGTNSWVVDLGLSSNLLAKVAVAATDQAGNLATQTLRFLPDDLYLDNLDPQYSEGQGGWSSTTNCAWGTDARTALLESNNTDQASWDLPLSWSGRYRISIQDPSVPVPATNVLVNVLTEGTNLCSVTFPDGIPTNQWAFVASVIVDQSLSNRVEIIVNGPNQPGAQAVADVLRVVPVSEATVPAVTEQGLITFVPALNGYLLRFSAKAHLRYCVQRSLTPTVGWSTLQIISPVTDSVMEYVDFKPYPSQAFYRIIEQ